MSNGGRAPDYRDRPYAVKREEPKEIEKPGGIVRREPAKTQFEHYERIMQDSFRTLCDAVATIKNKYLYRQIGFDSFEECCEQRWGWTRQRGIQLANANATLKSLPKSVNKLFTNEGQVRAIAAVEKEDRVEVMKQVAKAGPVTAKAIKEAARGKVGPVVIDVELAPTAAVKHCPTCVCR